MVSIMLPRGTNLFRLI